MNDDIGKRYGFLTVLEDTGKRYHYSIIYRCRCDCGNEIEVNSNKLHTGHVKSCGCKNEENKNNSSGVRGVHYDKDRKRWVAQLMFQRKTHLTGRFKTMREAIAARRQAEKRILWKV